MAPRQRERAAREPAAPRHPPQDFGVVLNLAFGAFKDRLHADLARLGFDDLGPSFGYVFRLLADAPANLRDVAAALRISAPGALKIVDDMVAKGYVERREHAHDARQKLLALTPRARRAMAAARRVHAAFERELAASLGERRVAATRAVLEGIVAAAEQGGGERVTLRPL